ncbi:hypothetical protein PL335_06285 [Sulfitobacter faviae]|uniref:hypothetical protein n=1 Tax=Sulfitobacter faviae TaxID=1775881 RepID=UPI0023073679|nr:hypothetical protein [Sulfitobacter faviae]WCE67951.1 hypothetical protein PL335_06285 [Sulfitobacter faviae]
MSARANEFLVWRAGSSVDWDCTQKDIAEETGISERGVALILKRRGWACRDQDAEFNEESYHHLSHRLPSLRDIEVLA